MSVQPSPKNVVELALAREAAESPESFYAISIGKCLEKLGSSYFGLTTEEAEARLKAMNAQLATEEKPKTVRPVFYKAFTHYLFWLLLAAAMCSALLQQWATTGVAVAAGVLYWFAATWIERQGRLDYARHTETELFERCEVLRDGRKQTISPQQLVPGDILYLSPGFMVPADARLIRSENLQVDEAFLTGETTLFTKNARSVETEGDTEGEDEVGSKANMVFSGTMIRTGTGQAVVVLAPRDSVMGRIETLARQTTKTEPAFAGQLKTVMNRMILLALVLGAAAVAMAYQRGEHVLVLVQLALTMWIAATPSILPSVANMVFAMGIQKLWARKIAVKNPQALETLGQVDVLCSDKTGTITENRMILEELFLPELEHVAYEDVWRTAKSMPHASIEELFRAARLNNSLGVDALRANLMGDPIDLALYQAAPTYVMRGYHKRQELPFDANTHRSATLCEGPDGFCWYIKGSPESVLAVCTRYMRPDGTEANIGAANADQLMAMFNREIAFENNYRIIALARKSLVEGGSDAPYESATFIGWVCLVDPPRENVAEAIAKLEQADIRTVMITGDQEATATVTAKHVGIVTDHLPHHLQVWHYKRVKENDGLIPDEVRVFARTRPEDKLTIVESLQQRGHRVAMVGDGINDTPALRKSDVAIAMGVHGSESATATADMILMNDRLEGIWLAVRESRQMQKKMEYSLLYLLSNNAGLLLLLCATSLIGTGMNLSLVQVLWLNLLMCVLPTLGIALAPAANDDMPAARGGGLTRWVYAGFIANAAVWMVLGGLGLLLAGVHLLHWTLSQAVTAMFTTVAFAQLLNLFNVQMQQKRTDGGGLMAGLLKVPFTWLVLLVGGGFQLAALYLGPMHGILGTEALPPVVAAMAVSVAILVTMGSGLTFRGKL